VKILLMSNQIPASAAAHSSTEAISQNHVSDHKPFTNAVIVAVSRLLLDPSETQARWESECGPVT
jgi:hypothetical protein